MDLAGREKILIHLFFQKKKKKDSDTSYFRCQEGIGDHVRLSVNRVSDILDELEKKNLLTKNSKKIKGAVKKRYAYFLTEKGENKAKSIINRLADKKIKIKDDKKTKEIKFEELMDNHLKGINPYLTALNNSEEGILDLRNLGEDDFFIDRKKEIKKVCECIEKKDSINLCLIEGHIGSGKSHLIQKLKENMSGNDFKIIEEFSEKMYETNPNKKTILLIDGLEEMSKELIKNVRDFIDSMTTKDLFFIGTFSPELTTEDSAELVEKILSLEKSKKIRLQNFDWIDTRRYLCKKIGREEIDEGFIDISYNLTDGRPLFLESICEKLLYDKAIDPIKGKYDLDEKGLDIPEKIKDSVNKKNKILNDKELRLLKLLSCCDTSIKKELITDHCSHEKCRTPAIIAKLKDVDFLKADVEDKLEFTNKLEKLAIYDDIPKTEKENFHKNMKDFLEKSPEDTPAVLKELGFQNDKIGETRAACKSYLEGARLFKKNYKLGSAINLYKKVIDTIEEVDIDCVESETAKEELADILRMKNEHEKALVYYKEAIEEARKKRFTFRFYIKSATCLRNLRRYDEARDNLRSAQEIISKFKEDDEYIKKRCDILKEEGIINMRLNDFEECQKKFDELKSLSDEIKSDYYKATALHYLGTIQYYRSNLYEAKDILKMAIEIWKKDDDLKGLKASYNNLGVVLRCSGDLEKAIEYFKKSNDIMKKIGDQRGDLLSLDNLGIIYHDLGSLDKSIYYHEKCLKIEEEKDDEHGIAATLDNIGVNYFQKGNFDKAIPYHKKSLNLKNKLDNKIGISFSLYNLGRAYVGKGDFEKAIKNFKKSLDIRSELKNKQNMGYSNLWIGITYLKLGKIDDAEKFLNEALELFKISKDDYGMGTSLSYLGKVNMNKDRKDKAKNYFDYCKKLKSNISDKKYKILSNRHLGEYYFQSDRSKKAKKHVNEALKQADKTGMKDEMGECKFLLGKIYLHDSRVKEARIEFEKALEIFEENGNKAGKSKTLFELGNLLVKYTDDEKGKKKIKSAERLKEKMGIEKRY